MPESEAKKKAYEYMRKKMGLTADNPFTEASEGGTKSAYNDSGVGKSKNPWKSYESGGKYYVSANSIAELTDSRFEDTHYGWLIAPTRPHKIDAYG